MSRPIETFLERWSPRALLALAVGIALLARAIALALAADVSPRANLWEYGEQAVCAIRHGSDLCLPYVTGIDQVYPSAYMPPLLSYYWLGLFHLVGEGTAARAIFLGSNLVMGLLNIWLVFRLTLMLGRSRWAAFLAAGLLAVYPTFVFVTATYHQTNWAVFFLLSISVVAVRLAKSEAVRFSDMLGGGLLCGLAALNRSEMLVLGPALIALGALWRRNFLDVVKVGVVAAAAMLLTLAPWIARNYQLFDRVIPAAQSTGYNLWKGFNPFTNGSGNMTEEPPGGPGDRFRQHIRDITPRGPRFETDLQDAYMREFKAYMGSITPARLAELSANKVALLWVFDWTDRGITGQLAYRVPWAVANLLAILGLAALWTDRRRLDGATAAVCAAALGLLTLAYVATAVHSRYRMHIEPFLFIAAGAGAEMLLIRLSSMVSPGRSPNNASSQA